MEHTLFSTQEAADYLGMKVGALKHYIYKVPDEEKLVGELKGRNLVFTQSEVDRFAALPKRAQARPRKGAGRVVQKCRVIARHNRWVEGASITESIVTRPLEEDDLMRRGLIRRFTATIRGFQNWRIYQGPLRPGVVQFVIDQVRDIRDRIDGGDEAVFDSPNEYASELPPDF